MPGIVVDAARFPVTCFRSPRESRDGDNDATLAYDGRMGWEGEERGRTEGRAARRTPLEQSWKVAMTGGRDFVVLINADVETSTE